MKKILLLLLTYCFCVFYVIANPIQDTCIVQKDETLSSISKREYARHGFLDSYSFQKAIIDLNRFDDPNTIAVGDKIIMPYFNQEEIQQKQEQPDDTVYCEEKVTDHQQELTQTFELQPKDTTNVNNNGGDNGGEDTETHTHSWVWLLVGLVGGSVFGILLYYRVYVKSIIEEQENKNAELSHKYHKLKREKSNDSTELSQLQNKIKTLEREKEKLLKENISLGEKIDSLKAIQSDTSKNRTTEARHVPESQVPNQPAEPPTTLYADAIIDDYFVKVRETSNEDSIFVLQLNGKNSADFDIYANAYSKVVANPSYLDGCEKQILCETKQIEVLSKGYTQQVDVDGKWKVIKKLNVIIK